MAQTATVRHLAITLSDVDRGVYESLELRVAQHPSESLRYLVTRVLAYCLSYEEGIAFSKGGLSSTEEPPVLVRDPTGVLLSWIDVGAPSAERLHKASKAARRVVVYSADVERLRRDASARAIHKADAIAVFRLEPALLDALEAAVGRSTTLELARNDGRLYLTVAGKVIEADVVETRLVDPSA